MQVKPLKTKSDYAQAMKRLEELRAKPATAKTDEVEFLLALTERYERRHFAEVSDPVDALQHKLDEMGEDERFLIGIVGHRTRVYEVMRRHRPLSIKMIRNVFQRLNIPADILIRPVRPRKKNTRKSKTKKKSA